MSDEYESDDYSPISTLDDVCDKLDDIERAVRDRGSAVGAIAAVIIGWLAFLGLGALWHSKIRYSWWYDASRDQVTIEKKPTDCDFLRAPLGDKECHYERHVTAVRVRTDDSDPARGSVNYVSFDDGKTWAVDTANPPTKPQVLVSWEKIEDQ